MVGRRLLRVSSALACALIIITIFATLPAAANEPGATLPANVEVDAIVAQVRHKLARSDSGRTGERGDRTALAAYYAERNGPSLWVTSAGFSARALQVIAEINKADDWGLSAAAFALPKLGRGPWNPEQLADAEIKLGLAVLKYARHARGGRLDPSQWGPSLEQRPNIPDPKSVMQAIAAAPAADAYLRSLHPKHPQFDRLRKALLAARGQPARNRAGLHRAERQSTQQLIINMERWRWMPDQLGEFHVWNNVAEFAMSVVKKGQILDTEKIIVGKPDTPTPIFSANMEFIVFHPEWAVPDSIKVAELWPYLRAGAGWYGGADTRILQRHNLRVSYNGRPVDARLVDWASVDIREFQFIQPAGAHNVLGAVKFRFPNKHDVYMHDTPQHELFSRPVRTFSHGCIRVQNPIRLAETLLAEDKGWSAAQVRSLVAGGDTNEIRLTRKIPVHVAYFTAVADDNGTVSYFGDIYGHDERLAAALEGRPARVTAGDAWAEAAGRDWRRIPASRRSDRSGISSGSVRDPLGLWGN